MRAFLRSVFPFSAHRVSVATCALALALAPEVARAAEGEQNQAAVDLAYEGKERFEAGDYATALDRFQKAQALAGSPVFDLYIARSLKALGRWREACAAYEETTRYQVEEANVSFRQAQENAARELRELEAKMPKLEVTAPHLDASSTPKLEIDGDVVPWPARSVALDPGKHVISARFGEEAFDDVVTLAAGQTLGLELPFGRGEAASSRQKAAPGGEDAGDKRGLSPLAWTAFGIGAAGLVVGATTGTWAAVNMSSLNEHCRDNSCPDGIPDNSDYRSLRDTTATLATTADIGFIVAGAGALLGVTFALTLGKGKGRAENAALDLRPAGSGVVLSGSF